MADDNADNHENADDGNPTLIDIAVNLTDDSFSGRGKYEPDQHLVLQRAIAAGVEKQIVCGGSYAPIIVIGIVPSVSLL